MSELPPTVEVVSAPTTPEKKKPGRPPGSKNKKPKRTNASRVVSRASESIAERVKEVAAQVSDAALDASKNNDRPPSESEWGEFGETLLGYLIEGYAIWLLEGADDFDGDDLSMSEEDRRDIVNPWARLVVRTKFNRKHGRKVIQSLEYVDSVVTLAVYMHRTRVPLRRKLAKYRINLPTLRRRNVEPHRTVAESPGIPTEHDNGNGPAVPDEPTFRPIVRSDSGFTPGQQHASDT